MHMRNERDYVWRDLVIAKTSGFCVFCDSKTPTNELMVMIGYSARRDDWDRAHLDCALKQNLDNTPSSAAIERLKAERLGGKQFSLLPNDVAARRVECIRLSNQPRGAPTWSLRVDDVEIDRLGDVDRARGAVTGLEAWFKHLLPPAA